MELWERIYEAAALTSRDSARLGYGELLPIVNDLIARGSPRARAWLDEALASSRMDALSVTAVRAGLHARLGDEERYRELAAEVEERFDKVDADDREFLAGYLAAGAEALGLCNRADALMSIWTWPEVLAKIAADRGRSDRAEALMAMPAFQARHWTSQEQARLAVARAYARAGDAARALPHLAEAEARAKAEALRDIRWSHLIDVAAAYVDVGARDEARRLALELDRAMHTKQDPRGAGEYEEVAAILHRAGDTLKAREIARQFEAAQTRREFLAARLWARIGDAGQAHVILDPLEQALERGEEPSGFNDHASIARVHLALGDVATALHRAAAADADDRIAVLRDIAAYARDHGVAATPPIEAALGEVLARAGAERDAPHPDPGGGVGP